MNITRQENQRTIKETKLFIDNLDSKEGIFYWKGDRYAFRIVSDGVNKYLSLQVNPNIMSGNPLHQEILTLEIDLVE